MEIYRTSDASVKRFKNLFNQNGGSFDLDRYIYHQKGNGLGGFFARLFHKVLPIIKGAAKIATPHAKGFLSDLGKEGINQGIKGLTNFNQKRKRDNLDNE